MDFLQKQNCFPPTDFDHQKNVSNNSELKSDLQQLKIKRRKLEEKISNHDSLKSEMNDLMIQLENLKQSIKYAQEKQDNFYNDAMTDLANTTILSEQMSTAQNSVIKFENENQELECFLQSKVSLEKQIINETKQLECVYKKFKEHNVQLHKKQLLNRKREELETAVANMCSEAAKCRGDLEAAETEVRAESKRLVGLQRRTAECDRTSRRLAAERADREAELAAFGAHAAEQLARAARDADATAAELAEARAALADQAAARRRAAETLCELQVAHDAEAHRWRTVIRDLTAESGRLTDRLVAASARVAAAVADNARLAGCARAHAERLADLTAEADGLHRRAEHERAVHAVRRSMSDGDAALLRDATVVEHVAAETARWHGADDATREPTNQTLLSSV